MKSMKKKIVSILLMMAMVLSVVTVPNPMVTDSCAAPANLSYRCGDVIGNGEVSIMDALEILKLLAKLPNSISPDTSGGKALRASLLASQPTAQAPVILDALEVLKHLAKLPNVITTRCNPVNGCAHCNPVTNP